ncbi:MAG: spore cortex biosynthesis protein YabQ [Clostridia bacterium]|nr:spore cortex biosynthesis protein YabQ [Clostridia bacterium]
MDSLTISQAQVFFIFIVNGILISFIFDIFRILRKSFKTPDIITYIEDIVYWIITCIILAYSIYKFNNGQIRVYIFIGIFIGAMLYILTISKYIIKINVKIISFLKAIIIKIIYYIIYPAKQLLKISRKLILKPICFVFINFRKNLYNILQKNIKKLLKKPKERRI